MQLTGKRVLITSQRTRPAVLLPIAFAAVLIATGCGGGDDADTSAMTLAQNPSAAQRAGVLYALTPVTGLVGQALLNQGWRVEQGMPPSSEPDALVYVDGSHEHASDANVQKLAAGRRGALLVDSRQAGPGTLVLSSSDGSKIQYASLHEQGLADFVSPDELPVPTKTDAVQFLFDIGYAGAENATALLVGPDSLSALHVLPDGKINHEVAEAALAPMKDQVESGWRKHSQLAQSSDRVKAMGVMENGYAYPVSDFVTRKGGYVSRSKVSIWSGYADNHKDTINVGMTISTAPDAESTYMYPNPVPFEPDISAGAFPESPRSLTRKYDLATNEITIGPALTQYRLGTQVFDRNKINGRAVNSNPNDLDWSVLSVGPHKYDDPDQTEAMYSKGFTVGGVVNPGNLLAGFFTSLWKGVNFLSISGSYNSSIATKRVTNQWNSKVGSKSNTRNPHTWAEIERKSRGAGSYVQSFKSNRPMDGYNKHRAPSQFNGVVLSHGVEYQIGKKASALFLNDPTREVTLVATKVMMAEHITYSQRCLHWVRSGNGSRWCQIWDGKYANPKVDIGWGLIGAFDMRSYIIRPGCFDRNCQRP